MSLTRFGQNTSRCNCSLVEFTTPGVFTGCTELLSSTPALSVGSALLEFCPTVWNYNANVKLGLKLHSVTVESNYYLIKKKKLTETSPRAPTGINKNTIHTNTPHTERNLLNLKVLSQMPEYPLPAALWMTLTIDVCCCGTPASWQAPWGKPGLCFSGFWYANNFRH